MLRRAQASQSKRSGKLARPEEKGVRPTDTERGDSSELSLKASEGGFGGMHDHGRGSTMWEDLSPEAFKVN